MSAAGKPAATPRSSAAALEEVFDPQAILDLPQAERGSYLCLSGKTEGTEMEGASWGVQDGAGEPGTQRWSKAARDAVCNK